MIGLGLPTVSMGLLSLVMAPAKAASLLIVPSFVTNLWQLAAGLNFRWLAYRLWPMLAGVVVGTLAGTGLLTGSHAGQAAIIVPPPLSLVVSQFEFPLWVGADGSYQASGPPDIRR